MSAVPKIFTTPRYGVHVCDSSRRIFHPHSSVPRHEADALRNDRRAVLSALPIHTAAINSAFKHQTTPHQTTVVHELHYKLSTRYSFVHSLMGLPCFLSLLSELWHRELWQAGSNVSKEKNFFSLQGKGDGQVMFLRHYTNRLSKRTMPPAQRSK